MGYIRHNAIVVTSWNSAAIEKAACRARNIGLTVLGPSASQESVNNYRSMLVCPDGSKEGWPDSEVGNTRRSDFRDWLESQRYSDGSTCLYWVEIAYSSYDADATIEAHAWQNMPDHESEPDGCQLDADV